MLSPITQATEDRSESAMPDDSSLGFNAESTVSPSPAIGQRFPLARENFGLSERCASYKLLADPNARAAASHQLPARQSSRPGRFYSSNVIQLYLRIRHWRLLVLLGY